MKIQIQIMSTIPRGVFFDEKFFDNEESRLFHYKKEGSKEGHEVIPTTISGKQQKSNQNFGFNLIAFLSISIAFVMTKIESIFLSIIL